MSENINITEDQIKKMILNTNVSPKLNTTLLLNDYYYAIIMYFFCKFILMLKDCLEIKIEIGGNMLVTKCIYQIYMTCWLKVELERAFRVYIYRKTRCIP